jgi:hypothetical protein
MSTSSYIFLSIRFLGIIVAILSFWILSERHQGLKDLQVELDAALDEKEALLNQIAQLDAKMDQLWFEEARETQPLNGQ